MKKITLLLLLLSLATISNAQNYWKKMESGNQRSKSELYQRGDTPKKYHIFSLDLNSFTFHLNSKSKKSSNIIDLPNAFGKTSKYLVTESSNFEDGLAKKFPSIKSYSAKGIDDPSATAKISIGTDGVHVMIMSGNFSTLYIDPLTKDNKNYISYKKEDFVSSRDDFQCKVDELKNKHTSDTNKTASRNANDGKLRTFKIAIASTGEYSQFHLTNQSVPSTATDATKKAAILSAMNTTIARVNLVYERDLSVKMIIVSDNEKLIFLDANTDNLSNSNANSLITESQNICDNVIGNSNYDIGHTFSTGAGGLAGLGVVCITGQKGRGVTGRTNPIGDPYDIDYVAHEIGHQFGANHTFNNSCNGNRNGATAVEPGSGSSIMGYAGICAPNVQFKSDDHFHSVSIAEMWSTIKVAATCATITNTGNNAPTADAGVNVSIPKSTPFVLKGKATDADGTLSLTYNWEQIDTEIAVMPPVGTNTAGPLFRSSPSKTSPNRYFPKLENVVGNTTSSWEVLPSVAREMNFSLTVRDNNSGGGASARDDIKITVADANPFIVTAPSTAVTWNSGSSQTITWDKSTTDQAPINCANVRIKLSLDGGVTFPITLIENTPNDGSQSISIPNNPTTKARILIEAVGNVFYNVNSTNFTIVSTIPTFVFSSVTSTNSICNNTNNTVNYTLNLDFINGFNETVSFSTQNLPSGASATFSPTTINKSGNVTMIIGGLNGTSAQKYNVKAIGTSTSLTQNTSVNLTIFDSTFSKISTTKPSNNSTNIELAPTLTWKEDSNASMYNVQIATDSNFTNIVLDKNASTNLYTLVSPLTSNTKYYWKVKPKNDCGEGTFSDVSNFTTSNPSYCSSTFTDEAGGTEHITNVTFNTINNNSANDTSDGYEDFTSIATTIKKGETYPISVTFDTGGFQDHCYVFIDWNQDYKFDNTTERYDLGTKPEDVATATFNIKVPDNAVKGNTRMRVIIEYDDPTNNYGEGACDADHKTEWGETEDYKITIDATASTDEVSFNNFNLFPNPSNGRFKLTFETKTQDKVSVKLFDIRGRLVESKNFSNSSLIFSEELLFNTVNSGMYLLQIQNGGLQTTKKLIIK
ncbi:reprolysin-like metallopeptidase [Tenacibaculum halocynthiae]|uniref:reprolysin-like metallopeptidase n=1 Tax=Tenacibaculum halocynthiae TaxID=1254437 RepID=UPI003893B651